MENNVGRIRRLRCHEEEDDISAMPPSMPPSMPTGGTMPLLPSSSMPININSDYDYRKNREEHGQRYQELTNNTSLVEQEQEEQCDVPHRTADSQITAKASRINNFSPSRSAATTTTTQTTTSEITVDPSPQIDEEEYKYWLNKVTNEIYPHPLKDAPMHIRNDKKIILAAVKYRSSSLQYASPELQNDKQVVMAAVKKNGSSLRYASPQLRNDKQVVMVAVKKDGFSLPYASPQLQNDKQVVMVAVKQNGNLLQYASPDLQNDKQVVMEAVQQKFGKALEYASPRLQNDREVVMSALQQTFDACQYVSQDLLRNTNVMEAVQKNGITLNFASPALQNDKQVVMWAIQQNWEAIQFASPELRKDREVVLAAVAQNWTAIRFASPELWNDREVGLVAFRQNMTEAFKLLSPELQKDKIILLVYIKKYPDYIKHIPENLKRDRDILIAAGMFDEGHDDYKQQQQQRNSRYKKIVLSTRFSLNETSHSAATQFTQLLKKHPYIQKCNFKFYAPNAFDKKTCDPAWTNICHPCRGTKDTCQYKNVLTKEGNPTDDCCWRYSFRSQLQEAKDVGGFMLQLIEKGEGCHQQELGNGQQIERHMAQQLEMKVFHVYRPISTHGREYTFNDRHINEVVATIKGWYDEHDDDDDDRQQDMSECIVRPKACSTFVGTFVEWTL